MNTHPLVYFSYHFFQTFNDFSSFYFKSSELIMSMSIQVAALESGGNVEKPVGGVVITEKTNSEEFASSNTQAFWLLVWMVK